MRAMLYIYTHSVYIYIYIVHIYSIYIYIYVVYILCIYIYYIFSIYREYYLVTSTLCPQRTPTKEGHVTDHWSQDPWTSWGEQTTSSRPGKRFHGKPRENSDLTIGKWWFMVIFQWFYRDFMENYRKMLVDRDLATSKISRNGVDWDFWWDFSMG